MNDLIDVEDSRPIPGIEWEIKVDRAQAGRFGADVLSVGKTIQLVTNGIKVGEYRPDDADEEIEIRVRYPDDGRSVEQLDTLRVVTPNGLVPISNFVTRTPVKKVGSINRSDAKTIMTVQANVVDGVLPDVKVQELRIFMEGLDLGDQQVLVEAAEEVGMDKDLVKELLSGDKDKDLVLTEEARAREMGVSGVPFFVFDDKYALSGAQDPATFLQVFDQIAQDVSSEASAAE